MDLEFNKNHIVYKGKKIELGSKAFFIDGQLSNEEASKYKYVYNSINLVTDIRTDSERTKSGIRP